MKHEITNFERLVERINDHNLKVLIYGGGKRNYSC